MLVFRVDETNFATGESDGVRQVADAGLKVDFDEFVTDGFTRGLWHLHDGACVGQGTGLQDVSGYGFHLQNHGAEAVEDGYRFVRGDGDYMDASLGSQPARSQLTLEGWVRDWQVLLNGSASIAAYRVDSSHAFFLEAVRASAPASSRIQGILMANLFPVGVVWQGAEADAILAGSAPWHFALVLDAPTSLRLYVNGVLRAEGTSGIIAMAAGSSALLRLGQTYQGSGYNLSAVLDEVRLSTTARYAANFQPHRLRALGGYTGPTFEATLVQAGWVDLVSDAVVPAGSGVALEVRAADEIDASGHPQAAWEMYGGDPGDLPAGRYFQWRGTLSATPDRLTSPTLASVEVDASEAGYNLYRATGSSPEALDYATPWACVGSGATQIETPALEVGAIHWIGIRPVSEDGRETPITAQEVRLELDEIGERCPDRPAGVLAAMARALSGGRVGLAWGYRVGENGVVPQTFRIFGDGGTGVLNYAEPVGEVTYQEGCAWFDWTSGPLADGVEQQWDVRAVAVGEAMDEQPAVVLVTPDASAPGPVDALDAEVVL